MEIDITIIDKFKVLQKGGISAIQEAMELSAYEYQEKQRHSKLYNLAQEDLAHTIRRYDETEFLKYVKYFKHCPNCGRKVQGGIPNE
jgi:hypothetical protein